MTDGDLIIIVGAFLGGLCGFASGLDAPEETNKQTAQRVAFGIFAGAIISIVLVVIAIANGYKDI